MLHHSNTSFTSFIPDPENQMRQIALGMAVRSRSRSGELVVDNFAGGGGASEGIKQAMQALGWLSWDDQLGCSIPWDVDIAINHDGEALVMHTANHPNTAHYQEDVFGVHPGFITGQRPIGLAWFSPDCKHHSKAKGGKPRDQKIRGLAWVALKWGALQAPRCIAIENVVELLTWGPLDDSGKPIKEEAGRTFRAFIDALSTGLDPNHPDVPEIYETLGADFPMERLYAGLGYDVEYRVLRACEYGVPTLRARLFIFARRDGEPICWPEPTHADPKGKGFAKSGLQPWRTAADCIDFDIEAQSIFGRSRPLVLNTERRLAKGIWRHVLTSADPFIVGAGGPTYAGKPVSVREPVGTVATENHRQLAQPVLTPFLTEHANASNQRTMGADEPLRTVCAQVKGGHFSVVSPVIVPLRGTSEAHLGGHSVEQPLSVISAQGTHHGMACAHLLSIGYGEREGQQARTNDVRQPVGTAVTANKHAVAVAQMEPTSGIQVAHLTHLTHHGERSGTSPAAPVPTVTGAHRGEQAIVAAFLEQANGGFYAGEGRPLPAPMSSVTSSGAQQQLINVYCVRYPDGAEQPRASNGAVTFAQIPAGSLTPAQAAKAKLCADLLHRHLPEQFPRPAEMVLVSIRGQWWILVDITLRMLTPRELARAQGFPDSYVIEPMVRRLVRAKGARGVKKGSQPAERWVMVPLSKTAQVRMIGNSVCPPLAKALIMANFKRAPALISTPPAAQANRSLAFARAA